MFKNENAAIAYLRQLYPDFDNYDFRELVDLICQDHAEENDTTEGWWELSADELRDWAADIVATCSF